MQNRGRYIAIGMGFGSLIGAYLGKIATDCAVVFAHDMIRGDDDYQFHAYTNKFDASSLIPPLSVEYFCSQSQWWDTYPCFDLAKAQQLCDDSLGSYTNGSSIGAMIGAMVGGVIGSMIGVAYYVDYHRTDHENEVLLAAMIEHAGYDEPFNTDAEYAALIESSEDQNRYEKALSDAGVEGDVPQAFLDPITLRIMVEPVLLQTSRLSGSLSTAHTVDKTTYDILVQRGEKLCPVTRDSFAGYIPNRALAEAIDVWVNRAVVSKKRESSLSRFALFAEVDSRSRVEQQPSLRRHSM